ncbi:hypothetical protein GPALN_006412 [Globodera pallida]|uniref:Uncharacterized protein n=1 Tax=Globodera pallida TaxID=36090 RepID=A0A183BNL8_GLOPA|nr:hypothetical protein GPALN_006412 [Globodera pallida]
MMLGAQALRTKQKAEKREQEKRKQKKLKGLDKERENLQRAAKRFGEAATSALLEYSPSFSRCHQRPGSARTHSIYDFTLSGREKSPTLIKPRFSLNVGSLSTREPRPSPSFERIQALLLLSPRSASGESDQLSTSVRARAGSGQSTKSSLSPSPVHTARHHHHRSSISSAGTRLLRWLGLLSPSPSADGSRQNGKNGRKKSTTKRRMSAL